jgi:hypothetical protein
MRHEGVAIDGDADVRDGAGLAVWTALFHSRLHPVSQWVE